MPAFCSNCGAPLAGPFCAGCGQRATQAATAAAQPPAAAAPQLAVQQPSAAPPSGNKSLLIIGGVVLLFGLAAFGAVFYGMHWIKGKFSGITGSSGQVQVANGHACDLLSTADLRSEER